MIYSISDIHGCYDALINSIEENDLIDKLDKGNKLILLGDYIDRGNDSFKTVKYIRDLQQKYGQNQIVVLRGNHEEWFLEFIFHNEDTWLVEDENLITSRTFLSEKKLNEIQNQIRGGSVNEIYSLIRKGIIEEQKEILEWMSKLPYCYETDKQIFVHAGVDEEAGEWWKIGTEDYMFLNKFPPTTGLFYKMVIAGHISARFVSGDDTWSGPYFDGESHIFIDNSVLASKELIVLAIDDIENRYYEIKKGILRKIS